MGNRRKLPLRFPGSAFQFAFLVLKNSRRIAAVQYGPDFRDGKAALAERHDFKGVRKLGARVVPVAVNRVDVFGLEKALLFVEAERLDSDFGDFRKQSDPLHKRSFYKKTEISIPTSAYSSSQRKVANDTRYDTAAKTLRATKRVVSAAASVPSKRCRASGVYCVSAAMQFVRTFSSEASNASISASDMPA